MRRFARQRINTDDINDISTVDKTSIKSINQFPQVRYKSNISIMNTPRLGSEFMNSSENSPKAGLDAESKQGD